MRTDSSARPTAAIEFALWAVTGSLGFFGLLRLNWVEGHGVLPVTRVQAAVAASVFGPSPLPVDVTLACSGADALALCLGTVLAYPAPWRARLAGAGGGVAMILALNTLRIGTLGRATASPAWFNALHLYVWPTLLVLAIAGYVFAWMHLTDRKSFNDVLAWRPQPSRRFIVLATAFVILFLSASPLYLESPWVLALAGFVARAAAVTLGVLGISAHATANVLWTGRGGFLVTQECISTPLIPIYLAGICAYSRTWPRLSLGVIVTLPLFIALGIVRLLVVALPGTLVASPLFFVHAFYQLLLGAVVVCIAALWRHDSKAAFGRAAVGLTIGLLFARVFGPFFTQLVTYPAGGLLEDPQGAVAALPAFQIGLYAALWIAAYHAAGWQRFFIGLALLGLTQTTGLLALRALADHANLTAHISDIRGWAVVGPLLVVATVANIAKPRG